MLGEWVERYTRKISWCLCTSRLVAGCLPSGDVDVSEDTPSQKSTAASFLFHRCHSLYGAVLLVS